MNFKFTPRKRAKAAAMLFLLLIAAPQVKAQQNNPLETNSNVWSSQEVLMLWGEFLFEEDDHFLRQAIYGVDFVEYLEQGNAPWEEIQAPQNISQSVINSNSRPMTVVAGDYTGDGIDGVLYAVGVGGGVRIALPGIAATQSEGGETGTELTAPETSILLSTGYFGSSTTGRGYIKSASGDFDGDGQDEFVVAVRNNSGEIVVQVIDTDGGNEPALRAAFAVTGNVLDQWGYESFDICAGDFNGDGKVNIAVINLKAASGNGGAYSTQVNIFEVTGTGSANIQERAVLDVDGGNILPYNDGSNQLNAARTAITSLKTGNLNSGEPDRIVAAFAFTPYNQFPNDGDPVQENVNLVVLEVSADLQTAAIVTAEAASLQFDPRDSFGLRAGDMNGNRKQEAVFLIGTQFRIYGFENNIAVLHAMSNQAQNQNDGDVFETDNFEISDIDKNGRENIIHGYSTYGTPSNNDRKLFIRSIEFTAGFAAGQVIDQEIIFSQNNPSSQFYFGLAPGNFDGNDLILGEPTFHECTYTRPLFILSPPPVHFDHFDGENFDPSGCFTGGGCDFNASNTISSSNSTGVEIQDVSDWDVSATVSAGYEGVYASVGASMTARYGEQFSNTNQNDYLEEITVQTTATVDDIIRGVRYPVHVYEYPVYNAGGDLISYISAAFPQYNEKEEYQQQGKLDAHYVPYYEPGNLLSYPKIGSIDGFDNLADPSALIYQGSSYSVTNNTSSGSNANISVTEVYGNENSQSWEAGASATLSASGFGLGFESEGNYNEGGLKINSVTISGTEGFGINYSNISGSTGFNNYTVRPFLFWNQDGTGVLAYQVDVNTSGAANSFWDIRYGAKPDPALMMPYRNEQYYTTGTPENSPIFSLSKSMTFDRLYPNTGEAVTVQCRVHNYSLRNTDGPVKVSFYNGHPDMGGELISSTDGTTLFETDGIIPARERKTIEMTFLMPMPVIPGEDFVRFYAVIDPENEIDEVHENNNLGWQVLGYDCDNNLITNTTDEVRNAEKHSSMRLWPNPANGQLSLAFNLAEGRRASVSLYDLHGRTVFEKDLGMLGSGEQQTELSLPRLPAGMYLVQLQADGVMITEKLMVR